MRLINNTNESLTFGRERRQEVKFETRIILRANTTVDIDIELLIPVVVFDRSFQNSVARGEVTLDFGAMHDADHRYLCCIRALFSALADWTHCLVGGSSSSCSSSFSSSSYSSSSSSSCSSSSFSSSSSCSSSFSSSSCSSSFSSGSFSSSSFSSSSFSSSCSSSSSSFSSSSSSSFSSSSCSSSFSSSSCSSSFSSSSFSSSSCSSSFSSSSSSSYSAGIVALIPDQDGVIWDGTSSWGNTGDGLDFTVTTAFVGDLRIFDTNKLRGRSFFLFDISSIPAVSLAYATLYIYYPNSIGNDIASAAPISSEVGNVIVDHIPAWSGPPLNIYYDITPTTADIGTLIANDVAPAGWYALDVTSYIEADRSYSLDTTGFRLRQTIEEAYGAVTASNVWYLNTSEATSYEPILEIAWGSSSSSSSFSSSSFSSSSFSSSSFSSCSSSFSSSSFSSCSSSFSSSSFSSCSSSFSSSSFSSCSSSFSSSSFSSCSSSFSSSSFSSSSSSFSSSSSSFSSSSFSSCSSSFSSSSFSSCSSSFSSSSSSFSSSSSSFSSSSFSSCSSSFSSSSFSSSSSSFSSSSSSFSSSSFSSCSSSFSSSSFSMSSSCSSSSSFSMSSSCSSSFSSSSSSLSSCSSSFSSSSFSSCSSSFSSSSFSSCSSSFSSSSFSSSSNSSSSFSSSSLSSCSSSFSSSNSSSSFSSSSSSFSSSSSSSSFSSSSFSSSSFSSSSFSSSSSSSPSSSSGSWQTAAYFGEREWQSSSSSSSFSSSSFSSSSSSVSSSSSSISFSSSSSSSHSFYYGEFFGEREWESSSSSSSVSDSSPSSSSSSFSSSSFSSCSSSFSSSSFSSLSSSFSSSSSSSTLTSSLSADDDGHVWEGHYIYPWSGAGSYSGANDSAQSLRVGQNGVYIDPTQLNHATYRTLIRFDITGSIPLGSNIISAGFYLYYYDSTNNGVSGVAPNVVQGDCLTYHATNFGTLDPTDFNFTSKGVIGTMVAATASAPTYGWTNIDVATEVQEELDDQSGDGTISFALKADREDIINIDDYWFFRSFDYTGDTSLRPYLVIAYELGSFSSSSSSFSSSSSSFSSSSFSSSSSSFSSCSSSSSFSSSSSSSDVYLGPAMVATHVADGFSTFDWLGDYALGGDIRVGEQYYSAGNKLRHKGYLRFDISVIPDGSTISSATLYLRYSSSVGNGVGGVAPDSTEVGSVYLSHIEDWIGELVPSDYQITPKTVNIGVIVPDDTAPAGWYSLDVTSSIQTDVDEQDANDTSCYRINPWLEQVFALCTISNYWEFKQHGDAQQPYMLITYT